MFILSVSILTGASWLFLNIIELPGLPFKVDEIKPGEILSAIKSKFSKKEIDDRHMAKKPDSIDEKNPKKSDSESTEAGYSYSFYDILSHQKAKTGIDAHFAVQIDSFKSNKSAQDLKEQLEKDKRLKLRVIKKEGRYAVLWSGFPTRNAAERYNRQLSSMLGVKCEVVEM